MAFRSCLALGMQEQSAMTSERPNAGHHHAHTCTAEKQIDRMASCTASAVVWSCQGRGAPRGSGDAAVTDVADSGRRLHSPD